MLARWNNRALDATVEAWSKKYDPSDDGTTTLDLENVLRVEAGLHPVSLVTSYPHIVLVRYNLLPLANRWDKSGKTFLHWIVRLDKNHYHDPYWPDTRGANLFAANLDAAVVGTGGRVSVIERPEEAMFKSRIAYDRVVHVLPQDASLADVQTIATKVLAAKQSLTFSADDAALPIDGLLSRTIYFWNIPLAKQQSYRDFVAKYYAAPDIPTVIGFPQLSSPPPPPPPPPPPSPTGDHPAVVRLRKLPRSVTLSGMHILRWIEDGRTAFDLGCRVFTVLDNLAGARELYDRGASVIIRHWYGNAPVSPEQYIDSLGLDNSRNLITVFQNECDAPPCYGNPDQLRQRFERDKRFCEVMWQRFPAVLPAIGGFSVGTPQIDDPNFAAVFRETYAAFANANWNKLAINWHLYTWKRVSDQWLPTSEQVFTDQRWWDGRAKAFAYSPAGGGLNQNVVSIADEIGREAGHGGFKWAGDDDAHAMLWWNHWIETYGGFAPLAAGTVFIGSRDESWSGYDTRYLWPGAFSRIWRGQSAFDSPNTAWPMKKDL